MKNAISPCTFLGAALLSFLLIIPAASATTSLQGKFTATSVQAQGPSTLNAPLVAFFQDSTPNVDSPASPDFSLAAQSLRVQTYYFDPALNAGGILVSAAPQASSETYQNAQAQGVQNRPNYHWSLFSLHSGDADIKTDSTCSNLTPSARSQESRTSFVFYSPASDMTLTASTADALAWTDCSSTAAITVTGNFVLMLWQWDATLHANGQDYPLPSGHSQSANDPVGSPETTGLVSYDRQRYLYVENGTLTIPTLTGTNYAVYAGPQTHLHADTGLVFKDATGQITEGTQAVSLQGSALQIKGSLDLDAMGTDANQPFTTHLNGAMQSATVDGRDIELAASTVAGPKIMLAWPWLAGAVGLVAIPVLAVPLLRRSRTPSRIHIQGLETRLENLLGVQHHEEAFPLSQKRLDWDPQNPEAHLQHGIVLRHLRQPVEALQHHERARELLRAHSANPVLVAENAYQAACAAASLHNQAEGAEKARLRNLVFEWMREGANHDPSILCEMALQVELEPFVSDFLEGQTTNPDTPDWLKP
jgi:hypothetical protein